VTAAAAREEREEREDKEPHRSAPSTLPPHTARLGLERTHHLPSQRTRAESLLHTKGGRRSTAAASTKAAARWPAHALRSRSCAPRRSRSVRLRPRRTLDRARAPRRPAARPGPTRRERESDTKLCEREAHSPLFVEPCSRLDRRRARGSLLSARTRAPSSSLGRARATACPSPAASPPALGRPLPKPKASLGRLADFERRRHLATLLLANSHTRAALPPSAPFPFPQPTVAAAAAADPPQGKITTAVWFPKLGATASTALPAGEVVSVVVAARNEGTEPYSLTAMVGGVSTAVGQQRVQNFTRSVSAESSPVRRTPLSCGRQEETTRPPPPAHHPRNLV
jgi:hypothetical protein